MTCSSRWIPSAWLPLIARVALPHLQSRSWSTITSTPAYQMTSISTEVTPHRLSAASTWTFTRSMSKSATWHSCWGYAVCFVVHVGDEPKSWISFQMSDQRFSHLTPGSLVFFGSKSLDKYVVLDYTMTNNATWSFDADFVEVWKVSSRFYLSKVRTFLFPAGSSSLGKETLKSNNDNLLANNSHLCYRFLHKLLSGRI